MSYLDSLNRFISNPTNLDIRRSTFKRDSSHKTTFKAGKLIPIYLDEILPGDTVSMDVGSLIRSITPAVPVMDNAFADIYFFWVPSRICTAHEKDWQKVFNENTNGFWAPATESTLVNTGNTEVLGLSDPIEADSIGAYMGLPIGIVPYNDENGLSVSILPLNAYISIFNEWFRDQNVQSPISFGTKSYSDGCFNVNKIHDYFTSCLPSPQKGGSVLLPIGQYAPVITRTTEVTTKKSTPVYVRSSDVDDSHPVGHLGSTDPFGTAPGVLSTDGVGGTFANPAYFSNLWTDLSSATAVSVNQMREAFAIQRLLEKDARGGTRYREMLKAHFGVSIPDNTVQVPEYLGGKCIPLNMQQVLQTSETSSSPLGTTGAFSNTFSKDKLFVKSFTEYGYIIGVCCVRCEQSYSQGVPRLFTRYRRFDFYHPVFANLGEKAVMKYELFLKDNYQSSDLSSVFGYQEAWAEYRYKNNIVSGELAPNAHNTVLSSWTYTNKFSTAPVLNGDFMKQPSSQFDDTFVVDNSSYHFIADFYFDCLMTRPMPLYSIPGLTDHH